MDENQLNYYQALNRAIKLSETCLFFLDLKDKQNKTSFETYCYDTKVIANYIIPEFETIEGLLGEKIIPKQLRYSSEAFGAIVLWAIGAIVAIIVAIILLCMKSSGGGGGGGSSTATIKKSPSKRIDDTVGNINECSDDTKNLINDLKQKLDDDAEWELTTAQEFARIGLVNEFEDLPNDQEIDQVILNYLRSLDENIPPDKFKTLDSTYDYEEKVRNKLEKLNELANSSKKGFQHETSDVMRALTSKVDQICRARGDVKQRMLRDIFPVLKTVEIYLQYRKETQINLILLYNKFFDIDRRYLEYDKDDIFSMPTDVHNSQRRELSDVKQVFNESHNIDGKEHHQFDNYGEHLAKILKFKNNAITTEFYFGVDAGSALLYGVQNKLLDTIIFERYEKLVKNAISIREKVRYDNPVINTPDGPQTLYRLDIDNSRDLVFYQSIIDCISGLRITPVQIQYDKIIKKLSEYKSSHSGTEVNIEPVCLGLSKLNRLTEFIDGEIKAFGTFGQAQHDKLKAFSEDRSIIDKINKLNPDEQKAIKSSIKQTLHELKQIECIKVLVKINQTRKTYIQNLMEATRIYLES